MNKLTPRKDEDDNAELIPLTEYIWCIIFWTLDITWKPLNSFYSITHNKWRRATQLRYYKVLKQITKFILKFCEKRVEAIEFEIKVYPFLSELVQSSLNFQTKFSILFKQSVQYFSLDIRSSKRIEKKKKVANNK